MIRMWILKKKIIQSRSALSDCSGYKFYNIWQNLFRFNCINFANLLLNLLVLNLFDRRCFTRFHYTFFAFNNSVLSAQVGKKVRNLFDKELVIEKSDFCLKNNIVNSSRMHHHFVSSYFWIIKSLTFIVWLHCSAFFTFNAIKIK